LIGNGTVHDFCPLPTKLCVSPASASVHPSAARFGLNGTLNLTLSGPAAWGCDGDVAAFTCRFTPADAAAGSVVDAPASVLPPDTDGSSGSGPSSGIVCAVPSWRLVPGAYALTLWYEAVTADGSAALAPAALTQVPLDDVIAFTATNDTAAADGTCSDGGGKNSPFSAFRPLPCCVVLFPFFLHIRRRLSPPPHPHPSPPPSLPLSGTCDACGACGGASVCLGCDDASPYADYDCSGQCDFATGFWYSSPTGACCEAINGTDCLGKCGGTSFTQGLDSDGGYAVCCKSVDCAGYCSGKAREDAW
jgi:hypothetical protein